MSTLPLASPKLYTMRVLHTSSLLRVETKDGSKKCLIDLCKMDALETTDRERSLVYPLTDGPIGVWSDETFTLDDLQVLASLRDRTGMKGASEVKPSSPSPVSAPAPIPVQETPISAPSEGSSVPSNAPQASPVVSVPVIAPVAPEQAVRKNYDDTIRSVSDAISGQGRVTGGRIERRKRRKKGEESLPGTHAYRISSLEKGIIAASKGFTLLQYDIPQKLASACPNPSRLLWGFGFRMTLSVWILPNGSFECAPIQRLVSHWEGYKAQGLRCRIVPAGEFSAEQIRTILNEELSDAIRDCHTSLIVNIDNAAKKLDEARNKLNASEKDLTGAQSAHDGSVRNHIKNAGAMLQNALQLAEMFDISEDTKTLIAALRMAAQSQAEAFNASAKLRNVKQITLSANDEE